MATRTEINEIVTRTLQEAGIKVDLVELDRIRRLSARIARIERASERVDVAARLAARAGR